MCGRFVSTTAPAALAGMFPVDVIEGDRPASHNVAPSTPIWAVRERIADTGIVERVLGTLRWGLVPSWAKDPTMGNRMINARCETVAEKPSFRRALARRRCIIPADGFYEWRREGNRREPWYFSGVDGVPLAMAGLWETWAGDGGPPLSTCTIITTAADEVVAPVHHRMPVLLDAGTWDEWLDSQATDGSAAAALLATVVPGAIGGHRVATTVNNVRNDGPGLVVPVDDASDILGMGGEPG